MCGITGIIDFQGRNIDRDLLGRMTQALDHRGPDGNATRIMTCGPCTVGLGHTRLKVIDLSDLAEQPMGAQTPAESTDGAALDQQDTSWILFNGEMYNFQSLRRELVSEGIRFKSRSDTEVVLRALQRWGNQALERFNGMWALCLIDERTGQGMLSRDRFGIKPLYWLCRDGRLYFASEATSLLRLPDVPRAVDPTALDLYLRLGYVPHPHSLIPGVRKLSPGHHLQFGPHPPSEPQRYHRLECQPRAGPASDYDESAHELRRRVERAVVDRMIADVPLGAFLSGGLDSSIVVAHMAENAPGRVKTFSIGFAEHPRYDETRYARQIAAVFGTDHHQFDLTFSEVIAELPHMLDHLGEPFGDSSLLPSAILSRHTRKHVTVALTGDAGDELFAGYWKYRGQHYLQRYLSWPVWIRRALIEPGLRLLPAGRYGTWANRVRRARKMLRAVSKNWIGPHDDPLSAHLAWSQILAPDLADLFANPEQYLRGAHDLLHLLRSAIRNGVAGTPAHRDPLNRILLADLFVGLPADMLHKTDLASMRYGLEARVPFLDPRVVEFASALPSKWKLDNGRPKRILADAYRGLIPPEILNRPKMGFEMPVGEWFRNELRDMFHDVVTRDAIESIGHVNYSTVSRTWEEHHNRRADHSELLFSLLSLCWWWRKKN